jgi:sugar/nucleoside kinase (ribokinase family)
MSKKYDVYGIGNALVDIMTRVEDEFFTDHGIEKGVMTLVDEDRQHVLMKAIDHSSAEMKCGGSAANTVIAVSQFGGTSYYSCKVAQDELGEFYLNDLKKNGVDTALTYGTAEQGITGKCLVMVTPDAERTMNTFLGITSNFSVNELNPEALKASKYLYMEGYLVTSDSGREAMKTAKRFAEDHGVRTALTFSDPSMVRFFKPQMQEVIGNGVDMLFANEEEAMLFTDTNSVAEAREALKKYAKRFAITQGKNGAIIFDGDTFVDIEPYQVKAIDSNGAGDMYAGAFMFGITNGHSFAESGKIASLAASKIVAKVGPRLEWHEAKEILQHLLDTE